MAGDVYKVKTVNTALAQLGNEPVADLGDTSLAGSNAAVKILRVLDDARDTVLARHGFTCALSYDELAPMPQAPAGFRYTTGFLCPGDFLRVWEVPNPFCLTLNIGVVPPGDWGLVMDPALFYPQERWQLATIETDVGARSVIMTADALQSLELCYVRRAAWGALSIHVRDAIGFEAAARACYSINGDLSAQSRLQQAAESKVQLAISVDATQEGGQPPMMTSTPMMLRAISRF